MQSLHGQIRWYAQACRPLHGMHSNISTMLSTTDPMGLRVKPPGTASAVKHTICKWILFWETLELHRIILQKEAEFNASYLSTFLGAVPLARRLAILRSGKRRSSWAVTLLQICCSGSTGAPSRPYIPWTTALQLATERCLRHAGVETNDVPDMMISIQELLWTVVAFAESCDRGVRHALHIAILDNQNAVAWIRKRRPKNLYAAHFIRIISRLEHASKNELTAVWVASGNNTVPDDVSPAGQTRPTRECGGPRRPCGVPPRSESQDNANTVPPATHSLLPN